MIIAHASDLHVGESADNARHLATLAKIWRGQYDARLIDAVVVTGDLTHNGERAEWDALSRALAPCLGHVPLMLLLGNHDTGALGITYDDTTARMSRREAATLSHPHSRYAHGLRVWWVGEVKVIGLDSQAGNAGEILPPLARGEIGGMQLAALEGELMDEVPTIIALHHHPLWSEWAHVLEDAPALLALIERRPHVTHVLYGHRHHAQIQRVGGVQYVASGKTVDPVGGQLVWREIDTVTGDVREVSAGAGALRQPFA